MQAVIPALTRCVKPHRYERFTPGILSL